MKYNPSHKEDPIRSRAQTKEYREGWEAIFGKKTVEEQIKQGQEETELPWVEGRPIIREKE